MEPQPQPQPQQKPQPKLTPRELTILKAIASGTTNKAMAVDVKVAYSTIVHQRAKLYAKLQVKCTAELLKKAVKMKLITMEEE